jgi:hypothetical protein
MAPLHHEARTVTAVASCVQAIVVSNAVTKVLLFPLLQEEHTDAADLDLEDALAALVNPPPDLRHAVRDTDGLRANGGLLVLVNLAVPLGDADDALSAQIARIVGEVVPWLFPPWELRAHASCQPCAMPSRDACRFVGMLAEGTRTRTGQEPPAAYALFPVCAPAFDSNDAGGLASTLR